MIFCQDESIIRLFGMFGFIAGGLLVLTIWMIYEYSKRNRKGDEGK